MKIRGVEANFIKIKGILIVVIVLIINLPNELEKNDLTITMPVRYLIEVLNHNSFKVPL